MYRQGIHRFYVPITCHSDLPYLKYFITDIYHYIFFNLILFVRDTNCFHFFKKCFEIKRVDFWSYYLGKSRERTKLVYRNLSYNDLIFQHNILNINLDFIASYITLLNNVFTLEEMCVC